MPAAALSWDASDAAVLGLGLDRARPERDDLRRGLRCAIRLGPDLEGVGPAAVFLDDLTDLTHDADGLVQGDHRTYGAKYPHLVKLELCHQVSSLSTSSGDRYQGGRARLSRASASSP